MATTTSLRARRSEAQLHALAGVERDIRAQDPSARRKYLREFAQAFRSYQSVLDAQQWQNLIASAGIILTADYHALPAAQRMAASLFEQRAQAADRPIVLGVETIFARDQHIVDEWWRREIDEAELRQRIRFDLDWGYDWAPFYELLVTAREHGEAIYGLDCMPREDLRKIGARDRHAAHKIAEIRQRHPQAVILVLFGESHLAPGHLPSALKEQLPQERVLTVLQNVDALYWHAAGEHHDRVEAVQVSENAICVFNSTPLEKYESYRLHLSRWGRSDEEGPDLVPTIYNLIDSLLRFLNINRYSSRNGTQPKFLVDLMPEVYGRASDARLRRLLSRLTEEEKKIENMLRRVEEQGSVYLPVVNAFYVREFQMKYAAEEAARFLHHACRGLPLYCNRHEEATRDPKDRFYARTIEHALAYFGSRALYPARAAVSDAWDLARPACEKFMHAALHDREKFDDLSLRLGYALGSKLYDAYLEGRVSRRAARMLFLAHLDEPGRAQEICLEISGGCRRRNKVAVSKVSARPRQF
ncbi:MAG TPA: ChaN family lipoprotein [Terriglobales bacterium]|nr:ChaN family lipoprotein [Terriglobales bacterium]